MNIQNAAYRANTVLILLSIHLIRVLFLCYPSGDFKSS